MEVSRSLKRQPYEGCGHVTFIFTTKLSVELFPPSVFLALKDTKRLENAWKSVWLHAFLFGNAVLLIFNSTINATTCRIE